MSSNWAQKYQNSAGMSGEDRRNLLLDDLQHEIKRLAEAVERQNELLQAQLDWNQEANDEQR